MRPEREPVEGRARGRRWLGVAAGLLVLATLPVVSARLLPDGGPGSDPQATGPTVGLSERVAAGLRGRLVYVADEPGGTADQRIVVLDLGDGSVETGPLVPAASALAAAGPGRRWLVVVGRDGDELVVRLLREIAGEGPAVEVARGELVSLSPNGRSLLVAHVGDRRAPGCPAPSYRLRRVALSTGRTIDAARGPLPCGTLLSIAEYAARTPLVSLTRPGGLPGTYALRPAGPELLFIGSTDSGGAPLLFALAGGGLVVWPDGEQLRVGRTESGLLGRIVSWSADGRHVAVQGRVGANVGLWLVDSVEGDALPLSEAGSALVRRLGDAAFDDVGTVFSAGPGGILALTASAMFPIDLPDGAPPPVRPIAWLP
jgi:hypothetical protein